MTSDCEPSWDSTEGDFNDARQNHTYFQLPGSPASNLTSEPAKEDLLTGRFPVASLRKILRCLPAALGQMTKVPSHLDLSHFHHSSALGTLPSQTWLLTVPNTPAVRLPLCLPPRAHHSLNKTRLESLL